MAVHIDAMTPADRGDVRRIGWGGNQSAEAHGIWALQGATIAANAASLALQTRCGFRTVGRRERIAKRDGVWHDTILTERRSAVAGSS